MIGFTVELMQLRLISLFCGVVVAGTPCSWGEPADKPTSSSETTLAEAEKPKKKRRGLFGLFKRKSQTEEKAKVAKEEIETDSSERRRKTFVTTRNEVPFYSWGPIQAGGPDRYLEEKLLVLVLKEEDGWFEVLLEDGETGMVPSDQLRKAKASDFPVQVVKKKPKAKPSKAVVVFERVPAPPLPELEAFDLDELEAPPTLDLSDNPLLFPAVLPEDIPN